MVDHTIATVEKMMSMITDLSKTIEELNATIIALQANIQSLKDDNALLLEENKYLKRKLFGSKSEKMAKVDPQQLSLFNEPENECDEDLLEEISYSRSKKRYKGERQLKLESLKHVKELYDVNEKDRICDVCHSPMHRVGEEFVRSEVVYEPAKLYVKDIYRVSYECRSCRKNNKVSRIKAGTPQPVIPHSYASPSALTQIMDCQH